MPDEQFVRPYTTQQQPTLRRMKKQYLSALVLALFTATASAQITTKEQANKQIEALEAANPEAAATAKAAVAAASDANGYNDAVKDFYQALDGELVYFTNSARGSKNYLTLSPAFAAAGDRTDTPTAENVFQLEYNETNNSFALFHAVTGRALKNLPGFNTPVPTTAEEGGLYSFVVSGQNNTFSLRNDATGGTHNVLHLAGDKTGAQYNVVRWSAGSSALTDPSTWAIESAEDITDNQLKVAALQRLLSFDLTSNIGQGLGERQISAEVKPVMDKFETEPNLTLDELQQLISAYADNTFFKLNLPATGDFFRIKSNDGLRYITTTGATSGEWQLRTTKEANDEGSIFCFDGTNLVSFKTGRAVYLKGNSQAKLAAYSVETPATVEFGGLADGKYKMLLKQGTQTATVHLWQQDDKLGVDGWNGDNTNDNRTHLQLEAVNAVQVHLNNDGLASFCAPKALKAVQNVTIYVANSYDAANERINLKEISGNIIPANTAVVLTSDETSNIDLVPLAKDETAPAAPAVNLFKGKATPTQFATGQEVRALKGEEFVVLNTPYVRGFRAYFNASTAGAARATTLAFPGVTAVDRVAAAENAAAPIFDLSGRRVEKPVAGQIYVQNGKKFLQR